jgi:hypothetical protein
MQGGGKAAFKHYKTWVKGRRSLTIDGCDIKMYIVYMFNGASG